MKNRAALLWTGRHILNNKSTKLKVLLSANSDYIAASDHSHPISMEHIENIFSALVLGEMLPNPTLVRLLNVKYKAVMYLEFLSGPLHSPAASLSL